MSLPSRYSLRVRRDEDGSPVVFGRFGQLYEYASGRLGCMVVHATSRRWAYARRACLSANMTLVQNGDSEGALTFDPENAAQAHLAIRVVRAKRRKSISPEHAAAGAAALARFRAA